MKRVLKMITVNVILLMSPLRVVMTMMMKTVMKAMMGHQIVSLIVQMLILGLNHPEQILARL